MCRCVCACVRLCLDVRSHTCCGCCPARIAESVLDIGGEDFILVRDGDSNGTALVRDLTGRRVPRPVIARLGRRSRRNLLIEATFVDYVHRERRLVRRFDAYGYAQQGRIGTVSSRLIPRPTQAGESCGVGAGVAAACRRRRRERGRGCGTHIRCSAGACCSLRRGIPSTPTGPCGTPTWVPLSTPWFHPSTPTGHVVPIGYS
jgi:hypothetical protein